MNPPNGVARILLIADDPDGGLLYRNALAAGGYDGEPDRLVRDLDTYHRHRLGLVLARAEQPDLVVVDDADADLSSAERGDLWRALRDLAGAGVAVVAACREIDPAVPDRTLTMSDHTLTMPDRTMEGPR